MMNYGEIAWRVGSTRIALALPEAHRFADFECAGVWPASARDRTTIDVKQYLEAQRSGSAFSSLKLLQSFRQAQCARCCSQHRGRRTHW